MGVVYDWIVEEEQADVKSFQVMSSVEIKGKLNKFIFSFIIKVSLKGTRGTELKEGATQETSLSLKESEETTKHTQTRMSTTL